MSSPSAVERPHTYGELRAWRDGTRWELIDGQAFAIEGFTELAIDWDRAFADIPPID